MALDSAGIATAIAALNISGVNIKDLTAIPEGTTARLIPVLFPDPAGWMGDQLAEMRTFGAAASRYWEVTRNLRYIYCHAPIGSGRGLFEHHQDMTQAADLIIEAFLELDVSGVDIISVGIGEFGPVADPSGNQFHGFSVFVTVRERANA